MNRDVRAPEIRVIGSDGSQLGIMTPLDAIKIAEEEGLDLVEVAPNAKPPTCKIIDYGKYLYEQKKKAQESKKKQVTVTVKELQIRPRTDDHDLDVKLKHARKFLLAGDKVRLNMRFRGREMAHKEVGRTVLMGFVEKLNDLSNVELEPKMEGQQLFLVMAPDKKKIDLFKKKIDDDNKKKAKEAKEKSPEA